MNEVQMQAIAAIEKQQEGRKRDAAWMIGEQLKDICRREPHSAELLLEDLQNPDMGLAAADKMLYDWGRNHKVGNCCGISGRKAEELLREFYGLPAAGEAVAAPTVKAAPVLDGPFSLNLDDFLG